MSDTATATISTRPKRWYIVHAYSNFENKVADSIRDQLQRSGQEARVLGRIVRGTGTVNFA